MDIFDFILLPRDRFYGGEGVWYYLPCRTGSGFPFYLASHDSRSVLAVKGPLCRFAPWTAPGRSEGDSCLRGKKGGWAGLAGPKGTFPDDDHVSLPRRLEEGGEPRAVLTLSGRLVHVDRVVADAGLAQSIPLQVEALGTVPPSISARSRSALASPKRPFL